MKGLKPLTSCIKRTHNFLRGNHLWLLPFKPLARKKHTFAIAHFCTFRNFPGNQRPWLPLSRSAANAGWPKFNAAINSDVNQVLHHVFRTRKDPAKEAAVYGIRWQQQDHLAWIHEDDTGQGVLGSWHSGVWSKAALQTSPKPLVEDSGRL